MEHKELFQDAAKKEAAEIIQQSAIEILEQLYRSDLIEITPKGRMFLKWKKKNENEIRYLSFKERLEKFNEFYTYYSN